MAVSSGRGRFGRFHTMEVTREFFAVSEPFWYTPLADKDTTILIEATPCEIVTPSGRNCFSQTECERYCALYKWCAERENFDSNGVNYIPCCSNDERKDNTSVFFKEIG